MTKRKIFSRKCYCLTNKTGLQPVSRPVELVHYFGGWVESPRKQTDRTDGGLVQSTFDAKQWHSQDFTIFNQKLNVKNADRKHFWKLKIRLSNGRVLKWWSENQTEKSLIMIQNVCYSSGRPSHVTLPFEYQNGNTEYCPVFRCSVFNWLLYFFVR